MNRPSVRGSPAGRGSQTFQLTDEPSVRSPANGKMSEVWKIHSNVVSPQGAKSLVMNPHMPDQLSPAEHHLLKGNGNLKADYLSSPGASKPCLSSSASGHGKRAYAIPLGTTMVLCFVSAFLFIGMLSSRGRAYNLHLAPTLGMYRSHRRLQAELAVDPFKSGIFGQGSVRMKELPSCDSSLEDYVPCYEQVAGAERHCPASTKRKQCLTPLPEEYKVPCRWPESRNGVWCGNMKPVDQLGLWGRMLARHCLDANDIFTLDFTAPDLLELQNHWKQVSNAIMMDAGGKLEVQP